MRWTLLALFTIVAAARATPSKLVVNGECVDCVTNREQQAGQQGYGNQPYSEYPPQQSYGANYNNAPNSPQPRYGNYAPNGQLLNSPSFPVAQAIGPQPVYGNIAPNRQFYNGPNYGNNLGVQPTFDNAANMESVLAYAKEKVNRLNEAANNPSTLPAGQVSTDKFFSGPLPDGTYLHNGPCTNCRFEK